MSTESDWQDASQPANMEQKSPILKWKFFTIFAAGIGALIIGALVFFRKKYEPQEKTQRDSPFNPEDEVELMDPSMKFNQDVVFPKPPLTPREKDVKIETGEVKQTKVPGGEEIKKKVETGKTTENLEQTRRKATEEEAIRKAAEIAEKATRLAEETARNGQKMPDVIPLLNVPATPTPPPKTLSEVLTEFKNAFSAACTKYENVDLSPEETSDLNVKLQAAINSSCAVADIPAIADLDEQNLVMSLRTISTLPDLFYAHFNPLLVESIKACENNFANVQKYILAMRRCCCVKFEAVYGNILNANSLPDIKFRLIVHGSGWSSKAVREFTALLAEVKFPTPINVDDRNALLALDKQPLYVKFLKVTEPTARSIFIDCLRSAAALKNEIETYCGVAYHDQLFSNSEYASLQEKFIAFSATCNEVLVDSGLTLPPKQGIVEEPCIASNAVFRKALETFFITPNESSRDSANDLLNAAKGLCSTDKGVHATFIPSDFVKSFAEIVKSQYFSTWDHEISKDDPDAGLLRALLVAVRLVEPQFEGTDSIEDLLCKHFKKVFLDILDDLSDPEAAKTNFAKGYKFCPKNAPLFDYPTVVDYLKENIYQRLRALPSNLPDDGVGNVFNLVKFSKRIEPTLLPEFTSVDDIKRVMNFLYNINEFLAAKSACESANPLTEVLVKNLRAQVVKIITAVPLHEAFYNLIDSDWKDASDFLKRLKPDVELNLEKYFFYEIFYPQLKSAILAYDLSIDSNKIPIQRHISSMLSGCPSIFKEVFPGVTEDLTLLNSDLYDLKLIVLFQILKNNDKLSAEEKEIFKAALNHRAEISEKVGIPLNILNAMYVLQDREDFCKDLLLAAEYENLFENYKTETYATQSDADKAYAILTTKYTEMLKVVQPKFFDNIGIHLGSRRILDAPSNCINAHNNFKASFLDFLACPGAQSNATSDVFMAAKIACADFLTKVEDCDKIMKPVKDIYANRSDFKIYVKSYYRHLLTKVEAAAPTTELIAQVKKLSSTSFVPKNEKLGPHFRFKVTSELGKGVFDFVKLKELLGKLVTIAGETIPAISELFVDALKDRLWRCYTVPKNDCVETFNSIALTVFDNQEESQKLVNDIFKKAAMEFINGFPQVIAENPKEYVKSELFKFQEAVNVIYSKYSPNDSPELFCWMNVAKNEWTANTSRNAPKTSLFFEALFKCYWNSADKYVYSKIDPLFTQLVETKILPDNVKNHFILKLKPKGEVSPAEAEKLKLALFSLNVLQERQEHFNNWKFSLPEAYPFPPQFYVDIVYTDLSILEGYSNYLVDMKRPRKVRCPTSQKQTNSFEAVLKDVPNDDSFNSRKLLFEAALEIICKKYETLQKYKPQLNELTDLTKMLQNVCNVTPSDDAVRYSSKCNVSEFFFDYYNPKLKEAIEGMDLILVNKYLQIMNDLCQDELTESYGPNCVQAENIPDFGLRTLLKSERLLDELSVSGILDSLRIPMKDETKAYLKLFAGEKKLLQDYFSKSGAQRDAFEACLEPIVELKHAYDVFNSNPLITTEANYDSSIKPLEERLTKLKNSCLEAINSTELESKIGVIKCNFAKQILEKYIELSVQCSDVAQFNETLLDKLKKVANEVIQLNSSHLDLFTNLSANLKAGLDVIKSFSESVSDKINQFVFERFNKQVVEKILQHNFPKVDNREDISSLVKIMKSSFLAIFEVRYPDIPLTLDTNLEDLKFYLFINMLKNNQSIPINQVRNFEEILENRKNLQIKAGLPDDLLDAVWILRKDQNLLKAFFSHKLGILNMEIINYMKVAAECEKNIQAYKQKDFEGSQYKADADYDSIKRKVKMIKKMQKLPLPSSFENFKRFILPISEDCAASHDDFMDRFTQFLKDPKAYSKFVENSYLTAAYYCHRDVNTLLDADGIARPLSEIYIRKTFKGYISMLYEKTYKELISTKKLSPKQNNVFGPIVRFLDIEANLKKEFRQKLEEEIDSTGNLAYAKVLFVKWEAIFPDLRKDVTQWIREGDLKSSWECYASVDEAAYESCMSEYKSFAETFGGEDSLILNFEARVLSAIESSFRGTVDEAIEALRSMRTAAQRIDFKKITSETVKIWLTTVKTWESGSTLVGKAKLLATTVGIGGNVGLKSFFIKLFESFLKMGTNRASYNEADDILQFYVRPSYPKKYLIELLQKMLDSNDSNAIEKVKLALTSMKTLEDFKYPKWEEIIQVETVFTKEFFKEFLKTETKIINECLAYLVEEKQTAAIFPKGVSKKSLLATLLEASNQSWTLLSQLDKRFEEICAICECESSNEVTEKELERLEAAAQIFKAHTSKYFNHLPLATNNLFERFDTKFVSALKADKKLATTKYWNVMRRLCAKELEKKYVSVKTDPTIDDLHEMLKKNCKIFPEPVELQTDLISTSDLDKEKRCESELIIFGLKFTNLSPNDRDRCLVELKKVCHGEVDALIKDSDSLDIVVKKACDLRLEQLKSFNNSILMDDLQNVSNLIVYIREKIDPEYIRGQSANIILCRHYRPRFKDAFKSMSESEDIIKAIWSNFRMLCDVEVTLEEYAAKDVEPFINDAISKIKDNKKLDNKKLLAFKEKSYIVFKEESHIFDDFKKYKLEKYTLCWIYAAIKWREQNQTVGDKQQFLTVNFLVLLAKEYDKVKLYFLMMETCIYLVHNFNQKLKFSSEFVKIFRSSISSCHSLTEFQAATIKKAVGTFEDLKYLNDAVVSWGKKLNHSKMTPEFYRELLCASTKTIGELTKYYADSSKKPSNTEGIANLIAARID